MTCTPQLYHVNLTGNRGSLNIAIPEHLWVFVVNDMTNPEIFLWFLSSHYNHKKFTAVHYSDMTSIYLCVCIIQYGTPALTAGFYNVHSLYPNRFTMHNTPLIIFLLFTYLITPNNFL